MDKLLRLLQIWSTNCCLMMHISRQRARGNCICTVYIKPTAVQPLLCSILQFFALCHNVYIRLSAVQLYCINLLLHCTAPLYVKVLHSALFIYQGIQAAESPHSRSDQFRLGPCGKKMQRHACLSIFCTRGRMLALRKPIQVPVVFCRHSTDGSGQMARWLS